MMDIERFKEAKAAFATYYVWTDFENNTVFVKQILSSNKEEAKASFQRMLSDRKNALNIILFDREGEVLDCIPEGSQVIGSKPFEGIHVILPDGIVEPVINSVWREMNKIPFYASDFVKPNC